MDENIPRPTAWTNQSAWPPPHHSTRVGPPYYSHTYLPLPHPPSAPHRRKRRGPLVASLVAIVALILGSAAWAVTNRNSTTTSAATSTTLPVVTDPVIDPAVSPVTQAPSTDTPGTSPAAGEPTTSPSSGTPVTLPLVPASPSAGDTKTTIGGSATSKTESLGVGVVDIMTVLKYQSAEAAGTGMVLSSSGEILTNNHVVDGATSITVTVVSTGKTYAASVVGTDQTHDVAVIQLKNASGLAVARIGDSSNVKIGDAVVGVGNAGGKGGQPTVAPGKVTDLGQSITATDESGSAPEQLTGLIQVDAALQPGESGGPLYNAAGDVIGMDTAGSTTTRRSSAAEGYAIPINAAMAIANDIRAGKNTATITLGVPSFLGIGAQDSTDGAGAVVTGVVAGSPADKLGLVAGDTITAIDGTTVANEKALGPLLHVHKAGEKAKVTWKDAGGTTHTGTTTLIAGPAD